MPDCLYLRPNVKLEPLVARWPAWPHLLSPATFAMNLTFRLIPHLSSFITSPAVHIAAAATPAMMGGPFVCLSESELPAARALLAEMTHRCAQMRGFATAYRELDRRIQGEMHGYCLDGIYTELPAALAGTLEIVYDLNANARLKVIEELLYGGPLDPRPLQEICVHTTPDPDRPFFMSTPILAAADRLFIKATFDDPVVDELSAMRIAAAPEEAVLSMLARAQLPQSTSKQLFTTERPERRAPNYDGDAVRVRYFGHACVLLQTRETSILIDPLTSFERDTGQASLTFADLPDTIDCLVISHCHMDHFVPETLIQLRSRVRKVVVPDNNGGNLADPSMKLILRSLGFSNIVVASPFDVMPLPGGRITSLPFIGEHAGLDVNSKQCVHVSLNGHTFLFLVDSDGLDPVLYRNIADRIGTPEVTFIGMECHGAPLTWLYGPLLSRSPSRRDDESRRLSGCNADRAAHVVAAIRSPRVFVYAMGQEYWLRRLMGLEYSADSVQLLESDKFIEQCRSLGLQAERLHGCRELLV